MFRVLCHSCVILTLVHLVTSSPWTPSLQPASHSLSRVRGLEVDPSENTVARPTDTPSEPATGRHAQTEESVTVRVVLGGQYGDRILIYSSCKYVNTHQTPFNHISSSSLSLSQVRIRLFIMYEMYSVTGHSYSGASRQCVVRGGAQGSVEYRVCLYSVAQHSSAL